MFEKGNPEPTCSNPDDLADGGFAPDIDEGQKPSCTEPGHGQGANQCPNEPIEVESSQVGVSAGDENAGREDWARRFEQCLQITAECQKELAKHANNSFERHALHPAIKTVYALASLIHQLNQDASDFARNDTHCPLFRPLLRSIADADRIAQAKCQYLDIETIEPTELDTLDSERHQIQQAVDTDDPTKHRRIERTLNPGLIYRDTVLQPARVSAYRFNKTTQTERSTK